MTRYVLSEDGNLCAPNDATEDADLLIDWDEFYAMRQRAEGAERDRDRWQQDSMRQAATINRLAAAAEDRNEVDLHRQAWTEARIAALEAALRRIAGQHCALVAGSCKPPYLCVTCIARAALAPKERT